jgi:hypothetical protein
MIYIRVVNNSVRCHVVHDILTGFGRCAASQERFPTGSRKVRPLCAPAVCGGYEGRPC